MFWTVGVADWTDWIVNIDIMLPIIYLIITALCWGITNVFIKKQSTGINNVKADNKLKQILLEFKFLLLNWKVKFFGFYNELVRI